MASWGSRASRPFSLLGSVMWWCRVACVTARWTVVSSRCRGSPFRMWGVGVPVSASPTDLQGGDQEPVGVQVGCGELENGGRLLGGRW